jgi:chemotaxis protein CheD
MPEFNGQLPEIHVLPGESHLALQPAILCTVLGSCVGITFFIPRLGVGALCHPMLPHCPAAQLSRRNAFANRRYVDFTIRDMAQQLDALGAVRTETQVKLFGGGDVLPIGNMSWRQTVGRQNSAMATHVLDEERFTVFVSKLGGTSGVHIQFDTQSGEVLLRRLDSGISNNQA